MFGRNKNNYFYESFENLCEYAIKEIEVLNKGLADFSNSTLIELKDSVHKIEHDADVKKKEIEEKLAKEFITPIDREDIYVMLSKKFRLNYTLETIKNFLQKRCYLPKRVKKPLLLSPKFYTILNISTIKKLWIHSSTRF